MSDNSREFTRVPVKVTVELENGSAVIASSRSRDLSLNGLFVECDPPAEGLPAGLECRVVITLGGGDEELIRARAQVVRVDAEGIALRFLDLAGPQSLVHLQNLVRYNAGELDDVEAELRRHVGLRPRPA